MKKELQQQLYEEFPKLYAQKDLPANKSCMYWGFDVNNGWYNIIHDLSKNIQEICDKEGFQVEAVQVKEKFGGLRFYAQGATDEVCVLISKAENDSYKTCERCGSTNDDVGRHSTGWILTLCSACQELRETDRDAFNDDTGMHSGIPGKDA